ncbi:hypothetical protein KY308_04115 [Candidatus Woesearchaeota archaeon]|nr:hypothetical protein [Candidatus Woesearchaeota archaeon]
MAKKEASENSVLNTVRLDLASGEPFTYDTNFLVRIAKQGKEGNKLLRTLSTNKNFHIPNSVIRELDGQLIHKVYDKKTSTYLDNFLKVYKKRKIGEEKAADKKGGNSERIRAFLEPMIDLLPKKIVADVFVEIYAEFKKFHYDEIVLYNLLDSANNRIIEKFNQRLRKYGIENLITDAEKQEYYRYVGQIKNEFAYFFRENKDRPREIEKLLGIQESKNYLKDLKIVSAALSHAEKIRSSDSDVIWLENFYEILSRKAA